MTVTLAVIGGSGSGKTTFARALARVLGEDRCLVLSQDSYYCDLGGAAGAVVGAAGDATERVNFDHPSALDFDLFAAHVVALQADQSIAVPVYDFETHRRRASRSTLASLPVVILEGTLLLSQEMVRSHITESVYLDVSDDTRLHRRTWRDTRQRGRDVAGIEQQWGAHVLPMHYQFVEPSSCYASRLVSTQQQREYLLATWGRHYSESCILH